ncbi:DegT/DnrJ/EryC1/StrS family aminotransferase [Candidatus Actinomarina]|nr:DegT/DnrJ/EryC1/StrS family aminotransferase [Candidatus Actinomarina sp.]
MDNNQNLKNESYKDYMNRISSESIPAYEPDVGKEELALLEDVINSNWISEGKYVRMFEEKLRIECNRQYALAFNNCTAALITGMKSLGLGANSEVIVQSLVHSADPNAISAIGAKPVFTDIDEATLCLTPENIDNVKTTKTKAVLYVSLYGNVSDLDSVTEYCNKNNLFLINDCAPALFGLYNNLPIASYGDFSALSFFSDKTITTGEGGMLLSNDVKIINESNIYKNDGRKERGVDLIERKGFNYRLTEFQAAVGVAQLEKSSDFVKRKKENNKIFKSLLKNEKYVKVFEFNPKGDIVPHRNIVIVPDAKKLIDYLVRSGIGARSLFMPMHSQPAYNLKQNFSITEKMYKTGVCLPSAPSLTNDNIEYICNSIKKFYAN